MSRPLLAIAGTAAALIAAQADAAQTTFSGTLDLHAGYGSNPYLTSTRSGGSGLVGGTLSAGLTSRTSLSTTTLSGVADVTQNFKRYGRNDNYSLGISRSQQLSSRFTLFGGASYAYTLNPGISYANSFSSGAVYQSTGTTLGTTATSGLSTSTASDPTLVSTSPVATTATTGVPVGVFDTSTLDLFTLGVRSQRINGNAGFTWTPTARDQISASAYTSRSIYTSSRIGDYVNYGGSVTYLRTLSARTRVGVDGGFSFVSSDNYPSARSYTANLVLVQQITSIWSFNGRIGAIIPSGSYGQGGSATLGFSGTLCGTYPRSTFCLTAARQAAPTGIGGLRTDLQFSGSLSYALDERTRVNATATYDHSNALVLVPRQNFYQASAGISRDLGRRFAIGASGRYQKRTTSSTGLAGLSGYNASGYSVTLDFITRFGRLGA